MRSHRRTRVGGYRVEKVLLALVRRQRPVNHRRVRGRRDAEWSESLATDTMRIRAKNDDTGVHLARRKQKRKICLRVALQYGDLGAARCPYMRGGP